MQIVALGDEGVHIFCRGKVNGLVVNMLVDTGASKTVIGKKLSEQLAITDFVEVPDEITAGIGPEKLEAQFANLRRLKLGHLRIRNILVGIMDISHVDALYDSLGIPNFDMILGGDVLSEYKARIDYKRGRISLFF